MVVAELFDYIYILLAENGQNSRIVIAILEIRDPMKTQKKSNTIRQDISTCSRTEDFFPRITALGALPQIWRVDRASEVGVADRRKRLPLCLLHRMMIGSAAVR